jgi:hypothetical protein
VLFHLIFTVTLQGENIVKDRLHRLIKEMVLLRLFTMGRVFINEEHLQVKEGGLGFYTGG